MNDHLREITRRTLFKQVGYGLGLLRVATLRSRRIPD